MTKEMLEQIERSKREVESWPQWLRESVRLEGCDPYCPPGWPNTHAETEGSAKP